MTLVGSAVTSIFNQANNAMVSAILRVSVVETSFELKNNETISGCGS
jgi:hypothetical protein